MSNRLTWHGHANFQIQYDGVNIIVDPFFTGNPTATKKPDAIDKPDIVAVTHMHGDHSGDAVAILKNTGAMLATCVGVGEQFQAEGIPAEQILNGHGFQIGGTVACKGVSLTMTQAFHTIDGVAPVGFIFTFPSGYTVYHAGDTGIFGTMEIFGELYDIDLALLPAGSCYTMDTRQAAYAAKLLKAKAVVPMHWGTFPVLAQNMDDFPKQLAKYAPNSRCIVMKPGETISLD
ncbi:MAG: metal-dependent hydrolase [Deltaproteobacteria bacterium]|nr:metal-dependent hydrolase [Deltaproteobacteria bacterium]